MLESVRIAANKNTVPGDVSAMVSGGIRKGIGSSLFYILILVSLFIYLILIVLVDFRNSCSYF